MVAFCHQPHTSSSVLGSVGDPTPFPTGRLSVLLFDFFFPTAMLALSISSDGADRTGSRSAARSHVKPNGFFFFYPLGKDCTGAKLCPLPLRCCTVLPRGAERGAVGHGHLPSSCLLFPHPGARPAGWPCSIYHCKGLECLVESLGKTLHDCDGLWVGGERDITHHLYPPSQWRRTASTKKLGRTGEGAHADEI